MTGCQYLTFTSSDNNLLTSKFKSTNFLLKYKFISKQNIKTKLPPLEQIFYHHMLAVVLTKLLNSAVIWDNVTKQCTNQPCYFCCALCHMWLIKSLLISKSISSIAMLSFGMKEAN